MYTACRTTFLLTYLANPPLIFAKGGGKERNLASVFDSTRLRAAPFRNGSRYLKFKTNTMIASDGPMTNLVQFGPLTHENRTVGGKCPLLKLDGENVVNFYEIVFYEQIK